jgi:DNA-binding NarL/FixJ family response regulator
MKPVTVVLADDHPMFRQGIRRILEELPEVHIIGEANNGLELLNLLKTVTPQLVVLDISMPQMRGMEVLGEIKSLTPAVKVLVLTMHKEQEYLYHAFRNGADGYLVKEDASQELLQAVRTLQSGEKYLSPLMAPRLQDLLISEYQGRGPSLTEPLTLREKQILKLIAEGKSSKEIAELLFISDRTVQNHRANIMRKLNLRKTTDLVRYALQKGYAT